MWTSIEPLLQEMADDETRFAGVKRLGVDEHVAPRQRVPIEDGGRGPKQLTGMVDLTRIPSPASQERGCSTWSPAGLEGLQ